MSKTVFFFGYSWGQKKALDAYQQSIANEFSRQGYSVRVYYSNLFSRFDGIYGVFPWFERTILSDIKKYNPDIVFSMNFGLLSNRICDALLPGTKVFTWVVDDVDHLFQPNVIARGDVSPQDIHPNITVYTFSSQIYSYFKKNHPELSNARLLFSSSVTDIEMFKDVNLPKTKNIVFVGSYFDTSSTITIMQSGWRNRSSRDLYLKILDLVDKKYRSEELAKLLETSEVKSLGRKYRFTSRQLRMLFSNLVSNAKRKEMVRTLEPLGVEVFGNIEWISGLYNDLESLRCFQSKEILSRADLVSTYQSSKLAVQIPQVQVGGALSFRIFDILASSALLIHPFHVDSDLFRYFGENCPVPVYKNKTELYTLCEYYLNNEVARQQAVLACNRLVEKGYCFSTRVSEMVGAPPEASSEPSSIVKTYNKRSKISKFGNFVFVLYFIFNNPSEVAGLFFKKIGRYFSSREVQ